MRILWLLIVLRTEQPPVACSRRVRGSAGQKIAMVGHWHAMHICVKKRKPMCYDACKHYGREHLWSCAMMRASIIEESTFLEGLDYRGHLLNLKLKTGF